jgi:hypothetical protein
MLHGSADANRDSYVHANVNTYINGDLDPNGYLHVDTYINANSDLHGHRHGDSDHSSV